MSRPHTALDQPSREQSFVVAGQAGGGAARSGWRACGWREEDTDQHKARVESAGLSPRL